LIKLFQNISVGLILIKGKETVRRVNKKIEGNKEDWCDNLKSKGWRRFGGLTPTIWYIL